MRSSSMIAVFSIFSITFLASAFIFLSSMGPLAHNKTVRGFVNDVVSSDQKVQRNVAKGVEIDLAEMTTTILSDLDAYRYYPLVSIGLSLLLNILSLIVLKHNWALSGGLFICAAVLSFFTIIPPVIQMFSGIYLLLKGNLSREAV